MKKKYIMPEAEVMKFAESEEIMSNPISGVPGLGGNYGVGEDPGLGWE